MHRKVEFNGVEMRINLPEFFRSLIVIFIPIVLPVMCVTAIGLLFCIKTGFGNKMSKVPIWLFLMLWPYF